MAKRMLVDATHPEETRVVVNSGKKLEEFDFETSSKRQIKGNIYLARVMRVEPSLQACFVDYGGNRHGFLAFSEIHPDYYRIPVGDRSRTVTEAKAPPARVSSAPAETDIFGQEHGDADQESSLIDSIDGLASGDTSEETGTQDTGRGATANEFAATGSEDAGADSGDAAPVAAMAGEEDGTSQSPDGEGAGDADSESENGSEGDDRRRRGRRRRQGRGVSRIDLAASDSTVDTLGDEDDDIDSEVAASRRSAIGRNYRIQEVIRRRQILLVQVTKEERGNKGAALTTFLSLAGRYCVLMPNTPRGGGISRKISNPKDRRKMKAILDDLDTPGGMAVILRTAGLERTKTEIKRDCDYLKRLWDSIREKTLKSQAPIIIHEEANIIKRAIRDLYSRDIEEVHVAGDQGYRTAKEFMRMLMPSHAKKVQPYKDPIPLFHRYQVEGQIDAMHAQTVQLRSGGYIVISPTEALVAIDVNSGKATRERNIEETANRTNLEAAEEIARQVRLRDLAGLIVIDFIDMEDDRHITGVERRLRDAMRPDRARIQLGRISPFGLLEMSRQRLRPSLTEAHFAPCGACTGTGLVRTPGSSALHVLRAIEEEGLHARSAEILVRGHADLVLYLLNDKRAHLAEIEERYHLQVRFERDDSLVAPDHTIERLRARSAADTGEQNQAAEPEEVGSAADDASPPATEETSGDGRNRRRRRRRGKSADTAETLAASPPAEGSAEAEAVTPAEAGDGPAGVSDGEPGKRRRRSRRGSRRRAGDDVQAVQAAPAAEAEQPRTTGDGRQDMGEAIIQPTDAAPEKPMPDAPDADAQPPAAEPDPTASTADTTDDAGQAAQARPSRRRARKPRGAGEEAGPAPQADAAAPGLESDAGAVTEPEVPTVDHEAPEPDDAASEPATTEPATAEPGTAGVEVEVDGPVSPDAPEDPEPRHAVSVNAAVEANQVVNPPQEKPRRGWWRRALDV